MKKYVFPILPPVLLLALLSSPCTAAVYTWKDGAGNAHYTNKEYEIPERFRNRARILYPDGADTQNQQTPPSEQLRPVSPPQQALPPQQPQQAVPQIMTVPAEQAPPAGTPERSRARRRAVKED